MRVLLTVILLLAGTTFGGDTKSSHPHFNDHGTLQWFTKLADAQAAAKKQGKLIFIEYGRET